MDYTEAIDCVDHNKLWKILREMGVPDHCSCLLRSQMQLKKKKFKTDMEQWSGSNLREEHIELYIVILIIKLIWRVHHMKCQAGWITSWNQDCWEKYKQPQKCRWYHSNGKWTGTSELLDKGEREEWKRWLKTVKNWDHSIWSHHFYGKQKGKKWKQWQTLFSWTPESVWMIYCATIKLKDACSLEGKLWQS